VYILSVSADSGGTNTIHREIAPKTYRRVEEDEVHQRYDYWDIIKCIDQFTLYIYTDL
jgi:hypothetical protein